MFNRIKKASYTALFAVTLLSGAGVSYAQHDMDSGKHPCRENHDCAEKWMAGDWHQHTVFTDGSNIMGDLEIDKSTTPPTFTILTEKYTNASPFFMPVREGATGKNEYKGVIPQGFRYGLDFQVNSEHGGNRGSRDGFGRYWTDTVFYPAGIANIPLYGVSATYSNTCDYNNIDSPGCTSPASRVMWRWQELFPSADVKPESYMSAFDWITVLRDQFPDKEIMTGMEWNVPGHEHASTGCIENNGKCIAEFEYLFDNNDTDTTGPAMVPSLIWPGKILSSTYTTANGYPDYSLALDLNALHNKTIAGLKWLDDNHPTTAWVNPAHIERAGCAVGGYSIAAIRDMNDTAQTVFFGFEGMPGHQKATNRGEFSATACGGGSYGGAGTYIAAVGGVWDNLLADGRKFFNFVSSDFHMTRDDFYPGEYARTYVKVKHNNKRDGDDTHKAKGENEKDDDDANTQQDILDGMRSGNALSVHGDIISRLDFEVRKGEESATMGETLTVKNGQKITVRIRFKSPATNNCQAGVNASAGYVCATPSVHHVQLIQGRINPTKASKLLADGVTPNPAFNAIDPTVASVVKTFDASSWENDDDGFTSMTFKVAKVESDMFFRIRGTNLGYNVVKMDATGTKIVYGTDEAGNPLINTPGSNKADMAWDDLWFYSNPIYVKVSR